MIYWIFRFICFLILKLGFGLKVYGQENIPKKGGFIIASNHVSYLDPPAVGVGCPRSLRYMAKEELFLRPGFAWVLTKSRAFAVKRESADLSALRHSIRVAKSGEGMLLFPSGRRLPTSAPIKAEPGIGFLVAKTGVPVIPAKVVGTDMILPKGQKQIRFAKISVRFGKEIPIERSMPYQDIADKIVESIRHISC